jgi:hypothetical protein
MERKSHGGIVEEEIETEGKLVVECMRIPSRRVYPEWRALAIGRSRR